MKRFLKTALKITALAVLFFLMVFGLTAMTLSENTTAAMIGASIMILLIFGMSVLIILLLVYEIRNLLHLTPRPVRTQLLDYGTEGPGRMAGAGIGSLLGGDLGMVIGFAAGGKKDVATFLVTYSNGRDRIESVPLHSPKYRQYLALQS